MTKREIAPTNLALKFFLVLELSFSPKWISFALHFLLRKSAKSSLGLRRRVFLTINYSLSLPQCFVGHERDPAAQPASTWRNVSSFRPESHEFTISHVFCIGVTEEEDALPERLHPRSNIFPPVLTFSRFNPSPDYFSLSNFFFPFWFPPARDWI